MWEALMEHFERYPAQERVVRLLIQNGLRIDGGRIHAGGVAIPDSCIGRAADVDRRVVHTAVRAIEGDARLRRVFARFSPTLHLKDVAGELGCGVIEIVPTNASRPGILAGVSKVVADAKVSIRQAIVEDPGFTDGARLYIVTEGRIPAKSIPLLQGVAGVKSVTVY